MTRRLISNIGESKCCWNIYIFMAILFLLSSCEKLIFSDNEPIQKSFNSYNYFSQISIYDIFEIELKTDSLFSIELETYNKYIENISIVLDSGELVIIDDNNFKSLPDYPRPKLKVTFPKLDDHILIKAPVKMTTIDTLQLPKLKLILLGKTGEFDITMDVAYFQMVTGSDNFGYYSFRGNANSTRFWPRGSSQVDASELSSQNCYVYNNSIGDCFVNVSQKLEAKLNTIGDVIYCGSPKEIVIIEESGSGRVIDADE